MFSSHFVEIDKEELASTSESNPSSFQSTQGFSDLDNDPSSPIPPFLKHSPASINKLQSYFIWFKLNGIESGDPKKIEQDYFKNKKEKIIEVIRKESINQNSEGEVRERATTIKRRFSKNLVIETKN